MTRYYCPFGCEASYVRRSDLNRRHIAKKHGTESNAGFLLNGERRTNRQLRSSSSLLHRQPTPRDQPYLDESCVLPTSRLPSAGNGQESRLLQYPNAQSTLTSENIPLISTPQANALKQLQIMLNAANCRCELARVEIDMLRTQLETERSARALIESQIKTERANTMHIFDVLRKTRELRR